MYVIPWGLSLYCVLAADHRVESLILVDLRVLHSSSIISDLVYTSFGIRVLTGLNKTHGVPLMDYYPTC